MPRFIYLEALKGKKVNSFSETLKDSRLAKYLWMEFILNPLALKISHRERRNPLLREALAKAASWYFAFRWLFKKNVEIERLSKNRGIKIYPLRGEAYRREARNFLKGIVYAGLC